MQTPVILIVEDEDVTRLNLVSLFEAEGYKVIEAIDGDDMHDKLTSNDDVNLVIMDINLPGKNGLILARELRQKKNIGLIFLTGRDNDVDRIGKDLREREAASGRTIVQLPKKLPINTELGSKPINLGGESPSEGASTPSE